MSVYVDSCDWRLGRMRMCHMVADSSGELVAMAEAIGLPARYVQHAGTSREHFDVCKQKRAQAVRLGAVEITSRELVAIMRAKANGNAGRGPGGD